MRNFTKSGLLSALAVALFFVPSCKKDAKTNSKDVKANSIANQSIQNTSKLRVSSLPGLNSNLIARWPLDGHDGTDVTGNGHTGYFAGTITAVTDHYGNANGAVHFSNGTGSSMVVYDSPDLRLNNTDFTLNAWVKLDNYNSGLGNSGYGSQIMSKRLTGTNNGWGFSVTGPNFPTIGAGYGFFGPGSSGAGNAVGGTLVGLSSWHMITSVYSLANQTIDLYIDGVHDNTTYGVLSPSATETAWLSFGYDSSLYDYWFNGAMDDIRIYGKGLSSTEIYGLYTAPNPTGLLAYWSFDGNANDVSGNGNNGTAYNVTSTTDRNGVSGNAYAFDGTSSYVTVPDNVALRLNNTDYTINAWVRVNSYGASGMQMIAKRSATATGYGWSLTTSGYDFFGPGGGTTSSTGTTSVSASATNWHMVTVTYKNSTGTLTHYVDGVAAGTYSSGFPTPSATTTDPLVIGRDNLGSNYFFNGAIDDVRIYNKLLTTTEITALKNTLY